MINWNVAELERKTESGYVTAVHWEATLSEVVESEQGVKTYYSRVYRCLDIVNRDEDISIGPDFIPFEQLTQQIVIQWVKDRLGLEEVSRIENDLQQQIEKQKDPPISTGTPW